MNTAKNPIAAKYNLPESVMDGRWHDIEICGISFEYISRDEINRTPETVYQKNAGFGRPNPAMGARALDGFLRKRSNA